MNIIIFLILFQVTHYGYGNPQKDTGKSIYSNDAYHQPYKPELNRYERQIIKAKRAYKPGKFDSVKTAKKKKPCKK